MNIKLQHCFPAISLLLCTALTPPPTGTLVDRVVAQVDDSIILQSELDIAQEHYLLQGGQEEPNLKCKVLEHMLLNKLLLAKARESGISLSQEEVNQELKHRMSYLVTELGSEAALVEYWGKPLSAIKNELREKLRDQLMLERMRAQVIREVTTTPQEVKEFFEALSPHEHPYYPAQVTIKQIVRYPQISQQEKDTLRQQLLTFKRRIESGESFEALAQKYSQDPGSAAQGGALGFWRLGELAPAYEATALALKPGQISEPVSTQFGLHLIQLIARDKDRYNSRHILLRPNPALLDFEAAKAYLSKLRTTVLEETTTFEQAAREFSEDIVTAPKGGLLTGEKGGNRTPVDELPSELFFIIEEQPVGTISAPMQFTTSDQQQAVRILLLQEKIPPHQANLVQDYDKIHQLLVDKKRASALQAWFDRIKADAFIQVAPEYQLCELLK